MAARRITASTVDWAEFAKKIPAAQMGAFQAMRTKQQNYARHITALPEALPKIEWDKYSGRIPGAMYEDFKKKYEALKVPYPKDTLSGKIEQQASEMKASYETIVKNSKTRIAAIEEEKAKWEAMMPVEDMNLEEALEYVPHLVVNPQKPTFWPHDKDFDEWKKKVDEAKAKGEDLHH